MSNQNEEVKLTKEDIDNLSKDLQIIATTLQAHDQTIFHLIASLNATQSLLIEKNILLEEDLITRTESELKTIHEKFMEKLKEKQNPEDANEVMLEE